MNLDAVIFVISAVVAVFGAIMMIAQKNPVASVLYLIMSFLAQAVLYIQLGAMFVGVMLVIVYAGAIMVLFLFVIMLLNLRGSEDLGEKPHPVSGIVKLLIAALLLMELIFVIRGVYTEFPNAGVLTTQSDSFGSIKSIATLLFTKYLYPFELTGVLLLVAVVGAVVIAKREEPGDRQGDEHPTESTPVDQAVK